jgi:hypothetical protein
MNEYIDGIHPEDGGNELLRNVAAYQLTRCHVSEDLNPQHHCENFRFCKSGLLSFMRFGCPASCSKKCSVGPFSQVHTCTFCDASIGV